MEQVIEVPETSVETVPRLDLRIPLPKMLTAGEELEIARKAFARDTESLRLRYRLAYILIRMDQFHEAVELLEGTAREDFRRFTLLFMAYIGFENEEGTLKARAAADRAVELAQSPEQRSSALADLAKTYTRLGEIAASEKLLLDALHENPADKDAYKRLSRMYMHLGPEKALALADDTISRGVLHARVLGSKVLALAQMGRYAEAHEAEAFDEFLLSHTPAPPAGWDTLEDFNNALSAEILSHPDMRYGRYGTASAKTWRVDEPSLVRSKVFPQLQQMICREVQAYVEALPTDSHPLARACPPAATLQSWCVVTEGEGHETWHVHQNGWMSGVYYIHVQDHIANGSGPEGCIAFGITEEIVGDEAAAAYGERLVRPQTGLMMMFPSHSFHKTYPHHGTGHRICFAFDIVPVSEEH
jgi:uncharacterized protein (TIGR02466 family)